MPTEAGVLHGGADPTSNGRPVRRDRREPSRRLTEERIGVHGPFSPPVDAEVKVGRRGAGVPGVAHEPQDLTWPHDGSFPHDLAIQVGIVQGLVLLPIPEPDHLAAPGGHLDPAHPPGRARHHRRPAGHEDVDAVMASPSAVPSSAEVALDLAGIGPGHGKCEGRSRAKGQTVLAPPQQLGLHAKDEEAAATDGIRQLVRRRIGRGHE